MQPAALVEREHDRRLEIQHLAVGNLKELFERPADAERLGHHFIVIAGIAEIEDEERIERFDIQRAEIEVVRREFEHAEMLRIGVVQFGWIDVS